MRRFYRFLILGIVLTIALAALGTTAFAQCDDEATHTDLYDNKFKPNYKSGKVEEMDIALSSGRQYVDKFKDCPDDKEIVDFINKQLPKIEDRKDTTQLYTTFNSSTPNKKWDDAFASGKRIIAKQLPEAFDVMLVLASIGFDNATATPPVDKYNADALNMAKMAIQKMESGTTSKTYGAGWPAQKIGWVYQSPAFPDGKSNALGWMNYTIGQIMYYRMGQKKEALPYFYKSLSYNSEVKSFSSTYRSIGGWYLDEFNRLGKEREVETTANPGVVTDKIKALYALQKGYSERAMDAYARAYKVESASKAATQTSKDALFNRAKDFYSFRFDEKMEGLDAFIAGVQAKPMPDPTSPVTPIVEADPIATTPNTAMTPSTDSTSTGRPTVATTTTPAKTTGTTAATTTAKPAAKKPVAKKKKGAK